MAFQRVAIRKAFKSSFLFFSARNGSQLRWPGNRHKNKADFRDVKAFSSAHSNLHYTATSLLRAGKLDLHSFILLGKHRSSTDIKRTAMD